MKSLKIGDIKLKNTLFLAPMVDITNLPYRLICRKAGAAMAYTEMVYVNAITHKNKKTLDMIKTSRNDSPLGLQITGSNIDEFKKATPLIKNKYPLVDINCGCPSIKITGNEAGSFLLKKPDKIFSIIRHFKDEGFIATAKIRLGFNKNHVLEIAKKIEKAGADAITVHARLAVHDYSTPSDLSQIKKVKYHLGIPVIGNGDIKDGESASKMLEICDGAMIARAAIGDPLVFNRILHYLKTGKEKQFDFKKNISFLKEYLSLSEKYGLSNMSQLKYTSTKFIREIPQASSFREKIMKSRNIKEIKSVLTDI